jgi:quinol monooxygenase YgiN
MIVVVGRVRTDADKRDALVRIGQAVAAASRKETRCNNYRLYEDTERENEFVFIEEWDSNEALQRHFATSHIREFIQAIPETLVAPPDVKFHNVASTMDLADVEHLTSAVGSPFSRWASRKRTGLCGGHSGCTVRPCATATRSHRAQHLRSLDCAPLTTEEDRAPFTRHPPRRAEARHGRS